MKQPDRPNSPTDAGLLEGPAPQPPATPHPEAPAEPADLGQNPNSAPPADSGHNANPAQPVPQVEPALSAQPLGPDPSTQRPGAAQLDQPVDPAQPFNPSQSQAQSPSPAQPASRPWLPFEDRPPCCDPIPLVQVKDLSLSYPNKVAYRDITLDIHKGCITALVGPSGCGKTSFLMSLNRLTDLIPGCRVQGSIRLDHQELLHPNLDLVTLRRRIGMIFQKPNPFPFSIRKNIHFPLKEHGLHKDLDQILEQSLRDVGLWTEVRDRLDTPAQSLSGGQQQRLCLARALALKPEVLLLDEPCSALDPLASGVVEDMITRLRGRYTIVVVTHNLAQARRIADHIGLFWVQENAGRLIEYASAQQFFESPSHPLTRAYVSGQRG